MIFYKFPESSLLRTPQERDGIQDWDLNHELFISSIVRWQVFFHFLMFLKLGYIVYSSIMQLSCSIYGSLSPRKLLSLTIHCTIDESLNFQSSCFKIRGEKVNKGKKFFSSIWKSLAVWKPGKIRSIYMGFSFILRHIEEKNRISKRREINCVWNSFKLIMEKKAKGNKPPIYVII